jgi:hypothetical protein
MLYCCHQRSHLVSIECQTQDVGKNAWITRPGVAFLYSRKGFASDDGWRGLRGSWMGAVERKYAHVAMFLDQFTKRFTQLRRD